MCVPVGSGLGAFLPQSHGAVRRLNFSDRRWEICWLHSRVATCGRLGNHRSPCAWTSCSDTCWNGRLPGPALK